MKRSALTFGLLTLLGGCFSYDSDYGDKDLHAARTTVPASVQARWKSYDDNTSPYQVVKSTDKSGPTASSQDVVPAILDSHDPSPGDVKQALAQRTSDSEIIRVSTTDRAMPDMLPAPASADSKSKSANESRTVVANSSSGGIHLVPTEPTPSHLPLAPVAVASSARIGTGPENRGPALAAAPPANVPEVIETHPIVVTDAGTSTQTAISSKFEIKTPFAPPAPTLTETTPGTVAASISERASTQPVPSGVRMVHSKKININYEVKDVGPSGVSSIELWYTRDGREWSKSKANSTVAAQPPYVVEVEDDGVYGFTLIVRSGTGRSKEPPHSGDQPQIWVEVDTTKPVVHLTSAEAGAGTKSPIVNVRWTATDNNLGARPITLSYAEQIDGPWVPFAANVENTGSYAWEMPSSVPSKFHVRVEAVDIAGNSGSAQTPSPVIIDVSTPSVSILAVEAGK